MFKIIFFIIYIAVTCFATEETIRCGFIPNEIYSCTGLPSVVKPDTSAKCRTKVNQCDQMTCIFKEAGWMTGGKVVKKKLSEHFDEFKREFPEWSAAVAKLKNSCIDSELLPQGMYLNCPAYDVMHCALTSFIQNTPASNWDREPGTGCTYSRQFAASCPLCPSDCFALLVPAGSCNACLLLPRIS